MNNENVNQTNGQTNQKKKLDIKIFIIIGAVIVLAIILLIVLISKGSKTLKCTMESTESGMKSKTEATIKFSKDKAVSGSVVMDVDLGEYAEYKDMFVKSIEEEYKEAKEEGAKVSVTSKDSKVTIKISYSKDAVKELATEDDSSYEDTKKELEDSGYTCK